jgi:hypothetical protein
MNNVKYRNRLVEVAAVVLLICSVHAYANDCAGGTDETGNDCNDAQIAEGISKADSQLLQLRGSAAIASLQLGQARQRQSAASAAVQHAETELKAALKDLSDAETPVAVGARLERVK